MDRLTLGSTRRTRARAIGALAAGALVAALQAKKTTVHPRDAAAFRAINALPDTLHPVVWPVMQFGSLAAVPACAAVAVVRGHPVTAVRIGVAGAAAWVLAKPVKRVVRRSRPSAYLDDVQVRGPDQAGLGYPAGHAAVSAAMAASLSADVDISIRVAAFAVAAFVAGSRVYVGAHLPLDSLGGAMLGGAIGLAARGLGSY